MNAKRAEVLAALEKITPQELAKVQVFVERQRVQRLTKAAKPTAHVWGGRTGGWPTTR
jgi:hypothetical protein